MPDLERGDKPPGGEAAGPRPSDNGQPQDSAAAAWQAGAEDLARWAWERLVNRTDVWGAYRPLEEVGREFTRQDGTKGKLGSQRTVQGCLTPERLAGHFRARDRSSIIGLHTADAGNLSKGGALDIDNHEATDAVADLNQRAALHWYGELMRRAFRPLLTESNEQGSYHLRVLLADGVPADRLFWFLKGLTADHAGLGMDSPPEQFPKQADVRRCKKGLGNWLRLPGRHHKRDFWSRVWDGVEWLDGDRAVGFILGLAGDSPDLVPADAEVSYRAAAYMATLPTGLGVGKGRDDHAYRFLAFLARDLALPDQTALDWCEKWDRLQAAPKGRQCLAEILANAHAYGRNGYGSGFAGGTAPAAPPTGGSPSANGKDPRPKGGGLDDELVRVIQEHFWGHYKPAYRRGTAIWSEEEGCLVKPGEALLAPDPVLIRKLDNTPGCPKDKHGDVDLEHLTKRFWVLGKVAWQGMLSDRRLHREEDQEEGEGTAAKAEERFQHLVRTCLFATATFTVPVDEVVTIEGKAKVVTRERQEKKQLIQWCRMWAKPGPWRPIRSKLVWARLDDEGRLCLAMRCELFEDRECGVRDLAGMDHRKFARLCKANKVGQGGTDDNRPGGHRVVVLHPDFIATTDTDLPDCQAKGPRTRTRGENCGTPANGEESREP